LGVFSGGPPSIDPQIAAVGPAQLLQPLQKRRHAGLSFGIVCGATQEYANPPHSIGLLRARRQRQRRRRTAEKRDELATPHSITSSVRAARI
jgi:hypothetical protein